MKVEIKEVEINAKNASGLGLDLVNMMPAENRELFFSEMKKNNPGVKNYEVQTDGCVEYVYASSKKEALAKVKEGEKHEV